MQEQIYLIGLKIGLRRAQNKKKKPSHNCGNIYKLMNCRVNRTHLFKNQGIFLKYFEEQ